MTAKWMDDVVQAFGRQLGLAEFTLGETGSAGISFENGMTLRLESAPGALFLMVGVPSGDEAQLKRLLTAAHPAVQRGRAVRAIRLAKSGEDMLAVRIAEREVTADALAREFRTLFESARGVAGGGEWH